MIAAETVGSHEPTDYTLKLDTHERLYSTTAPKLSVLLRLHETHVNAGQYADHDAAAVAAQKRYKKWLTWGNIAILAATIAGALLMAQEILWPAPPSVAGSATMASLGSIALAAMTVIAGAAAAYGVFMLREGKMLEVWMGARATAETNRLGYFSALTARAINAGDLETMSLMLEYYRRFQLEFQVAFYDSASKRHAASADFTLRLGGIGVAIAALAGFGGLPGNMWTAFGALSVAGAAVGSFAAGRELMHQDRRNAERYRRTLDAILGVAKRLDDVRAAVSAGNAAALTEFVAAVNDQISLEHRQWLEDGEGAKAALARLEEALAAGSTKETADAQDRSDT